MRPFANLAISAHAGTGKTFRLAHRYIGLMAAGVRPERICALTFSRKGASEMFDAIVQRLCAAAEDPDARRQSIETIRASGLPAPNDPAAWRGMLRQLMDQIHRLRISTLDSFLVGIVRAFPMELGVPPEVRPTEDEGGEALALRRALFMRLYQPAPEGGATDAFLSAFRWASAGMERKSLDRLLNRWIQDYKQVYDAHRPPLCSWGELDAVMPRSSRWWESLAKTTAALPESLEDWCRQTFHGNSRLASDCANLIRLGWSYAPDHPYPDILEKALGQRLLEHLAEETPPAISYRRNSYPLPPALWKLIRIALARIVAVELERCAWTARGLSEIFSQYDRLYWPAARARGQYSFEDLARLLGGDGPRLSRHPDRPDRLYVDYRLDAALDHWLLDEFQDTSNIQWRALENLVDEIIQDPERSLFYVGDIKQSIYGWRGGNCRLFHQLLDRYAQAGDRAIREERIEVCRRSLPAVVETVNKVFDQLSAWRPARVPEGGPRPDAVKTFERAWSLHRSAEQQKSQGYAALYEYQAAKKNGDNTEEDVGPPAFEAIAELLAKIEPTRRGLETAVLVRTNEEGKTCVDVLRRRLPNLPVTHEGIGGIVDHPVVTLMRSLFRYAAHPADTVALRHLQMSPLADQLPSGWETHWPALLLTQIHDEGFAAVIRQWGARLAACLDASGCQRLSELIEAAEAFDALGDGDLDLFDDFLSAYAVRNEPVIGAIRVMTIHQAKGLGFDCVFVPFAPHAESFTNPEMRPALIGKRWVLSPPKRPVVEVVDGELAAAREQQASDENFEQLCVLYVALTRAKKALYLLVPPPAANASACRPADLLRERLAPDVQEALREEEGLRLLYQTGDPHWYASIASPPPAAMRPPSPIRATYVTPLRRREPSKETARPPTRSSAWLFDPAYHARRNFGAAIHDLFQRIEWIEETDVEAILRDWFAEWPGTADLKAEVEKQFRACLADRAIRRYFERPHQAVRAAAWREAPFYVVIEDPGGPQLLSGRFDRLVIEWDADVSPIRATVLDFKSDRIETEAALRATVEAYRPQMSDYARAAAELLGIPRRSVHCVLVFTYPIRVVEW